MLVKNITDSAVVLNCEGVYDPIILPVKSSISLPISGWGQISNWKDVASKVSLDNAQPVVKNEEVKKITPPTPRSKKNK